MLATTIAIVLTSALTIGGVALAVTPDDLPEPSRQMLEESVHEVESERSVHRLDPGDSVHDMILQDSVKSLATEAPVGPDTVVTLRSDILFDFNSATLPAAAPAAIDEALSGAPNGAAVTVAGHTDSIGDDAANRVLSQQRADAVAAAIAQVRPDLVLVAAGYGETQPIAENTSGGEDNPEGRALNRRVEVTFATG